MQFVGVEPQGEDRVLLKAKTTPDADKSRLRTEYYYTYDRVKGLPEQDIIQSLLAKKDQYISELENIIEALEKLSLYLNQEQGKPVGEQIVDHKCEELVSISLDLYEKVTSKKICPVLTISFGNPEVRIPQPDKTEKTLCLKFDIKSGEICFFLINGKMPINQRKELVNQDEGWKGSPVGINKPIWEFRCRNELRGEDEFRILYGLLQNKNLGVIDLITSNSCCEIEIVFKISVNRNYIVITGLDDGTNTKVQKENKIGLLLKYLENKLENYVSKVVIKYDPTTIPGRAW